TSDRTVDRSVNPTADSAAKPAAKPTAKPAAHQASSFTPPPSVSREAANKSQGGVQSPNQNQTTAFNGQTSSLRGGASGAESGRHLMSDEKSGGPPPAGAKLIIQRGGKVGKEFPITGSDSMIGRWDADGGIFPDIDLDQDDPEAKVSRRHARIQFLNNQYLIEDLGSTNGTFINRGPRLLPGAKQPLNHGDEIIVGKTFLKFILN
ncbi:MAG: FHA domain-containing protein, partial [Blastocatellia bacterium]